MSDILKHLAEKLHRQYGLIVRRPMPWRMIDALVTLEEKLEARDKPGQNSQPAAMDGEVRPSTDGQDRSKPPPIQR